MKLFKLLQGSILVLALIALVGISQKAHAQYSLHPVTVDVTPQEFQAVYAFGVIPISQVTATHFIGKGPGGGTAPWPPIGPDGPPCPDAEGMTPELAAYMTAMANQYCRPMYTCVQEEDCGWYMYVFQPTSPRCQFAVQYQATLNAFAL